LAESIVNLKQANVSLNVIFFIKTDLWDSSDGFQLLFWRLQ